MKTLLSAVAALPLLTGVALATEPVAQQPQKQPMQLTSNQMDKVTAGFTFTEITRSNTSLVGVFVDLPAPVCTGCFLGVRSSNLSVLAAFLP